MVKKKSMYMMPRQLSSDRIECRFRLIQNRRIRPAHNLLLTFCENPIRHDCPGVCVPPSLGSPAVAAATIP